MRVEVLLDFPRQTARDLANDLPQKVIATGLDQGFWQHANKGGQSYRHSKIKLPLHQGVLLLGAELKAGLEIHAVPLI